MSASEVVYKFPEDCTLRNIRSVFQPLRDIYKKRKEICIDLSSVSAMDLAGIQLIIALFQSAVEGKKQIRIAGTVSVPVKRSLHTAGVRLKQTADAEETASAILDFLKEPL